jgi:hypothetical protein
MAGPDNESGASRSSGASDSTSTSGMVQSATSAASDIAQQAGARVREQASHATGQVQEHAKAFLSEQKGVAADHIEGVAKVLHETVDQLRQRSPGAVTDYAERAVGGLDSLADALREQDVRALVGQVEDFARRQPVLFIAGTVAIGFALARFLKSSSRSGGYGHASGQYGAQRQNYRSSSAAGQASPRTEFSRHMDTESGHTSGTTSSSSAGNGAPPSGEEQR